MTKIIFYLTLFPLLIYHTLVFAADYYPLHTGDVWYVGGIPQQIGETEDIDSNKYFKVYKKQEFDYYCRKDETGKVYKKYPDKEETLYVDLNAEVGDSWLYRCVSDFLYEVTLESKTESVETDFGVIDSCYKYSFIAEPYVYDADYAIFLAPDIGLIKTKSTSWGTEQTLIKARINGQKIPADTPSPVIYRTIPTDQQTEIPIDTYIKIFFNYHILESTISSQTFIVKSKKSGIITGTFDQTSICTFYPDTPLAYDDVIEISLTTDITDYVGDNLEETYTFSFTTETSKHEMVLFEEDKRAVLTDLGWGDFDWGDYDNDGDPDLILFSEQNSKGYIQLFKNMDGLFEKNDFGAVEISPSFCIGKNCIRWFDYSSDGNLDFVFSGVGEGKQWRTLFYLNSDDGFVQDGMELPVGNASLDCYDYNRDGYFDLLISGNSKTEKCRTAVYQNNGQGRLILTYNSQFPYYNAELVYWIDLNDDGVKDIIAIGPDRLSYTGFYEYDEGQFVKLDISMDTDETVGLGRVRARYYCDSTDIEGDGDIDLIIGPYLMLRKNNSFSITMLETYELAAIPKFYDFDNDGDDDLLIAGRKRDPVGRIRGYIQIYENLEGELLLTEDIALDYGLFIYSGKWYDINNDGQPDLSVFTDKGFMIYYSTMDNVTSVKSADRDGQVSFDMKAFPNPFNPSTTIKFTLPNDDLITLSVYSITGQKVATLVDEHLEAGNHSVVFDGIGLSSGLYFCTLKANGFIETRKMLLVK